MNRISMILGFSVTLGKTCMYMLGFTANCDRMEAQKAKKEHTMPLNMLAFHGSPKRFPSVSQDFPSGSLPLFKGENNAFNHWLTQALLKKQSLKHSESMLSTTPMLCIRLDTRWIDFKTSVSSIGQKDQWHMKTVAMKFPDVNLQKSYMKTCCAALAV